MLAVSETWPEAIACLTLPSFQRLITTTWESGMLRAGVVTSPFLKPSPIVNGARVCVVGVSSVNAGPGDAADVRHAGRRCDNARGALRPVQVNAHASGVTLAPCD